MSTSSVCTNPTIDTMVGPSPYHDCPYVARACLLVRMHSLTYVRLAFSWVWYQGEANDLGKQGAFVGPESYKCHFPSMIASWRTAWNQPDLPFYYVLLAAGHTAILREAQVAGASLLPQTAWATAADLGDGVAGGPDGPCPVPGHPRRKQEVGRRLALAALNRSYSEAVREAF